MRLGRKNLLYSMALAGVMMLFLVGYFIYMLPSLYVDHMMEQNLRSVYEQHRAYMESGSYDGVRVRNATACFSVEIPVEGDSVLVTGKAFSAEIALKDKRIAEILDSCREKLEAGEILGEPDAGMQDGSGGEREAADSPAKADQGAWRLDLADEAKALEEILKEAVSDAGSFPVEVRLLSNNGIEEEFFNESIKVHIYSGDLVIMESSVEDAHNRYANYIAMEQTENSTVLSYLPVVAPDVEEIRPVVLQSLPMLGAVIVLLVLLFSQMYSRGIVGPILRLARHAEEMA